jgi:hypothetical protein
METLIELLKEKKYRLTFLFHLNKQRSEGKFTLTFDCYNIIGDILNHILDLIVNDKDYESARYCIILSQTFHFIGREKQKFYLQRKIERHDLLKMTDFWENFIACTIHYI